MIHIPANPQSYRWNYILWYAALQPLQNQKVKRMKTRRKREPMNRESCLRPLDLSTWLPIKHTCAPVSVLFSSSEFIKRDQITWHSTLHLLHAYKQYLSPQLLNPRLSPVLVTTSSACCLSRFTVVGSLFCDHRCLPPLPETSLIRANQTKNPSSKTMNSPGHILQAWWMILRAVRRHKFTAKSSARPELSLISTLQGSSASCPNKSTRRNSVTPALCSAETEEFIMYCSLCWLNDAKLNQQISSLALTHMLRRPRHPQCSGRCSSCLLVAAFEIVSLPSRLCSDERCGDHRERQRRYEEVWSVVQRQRGGLHHPGMLKTNLSFLFYL